MIYKTFDVVVVPFPFTDINRSKKRPALVLSSAHNFGDVVKQSVLAMITSARNSSWPLDISITDLEVAGLSKPSIIRYKLFTLDHSIISQKIGELSAFDQQQLIKNFKTVFSDLLVVAK